MKFKYIRLGTLSYRNLYASSPVAFVEMYDSVMDRKFSPYNFGEKYKLNDYIYLVYTIVGLQEFKAESILELLQMVGDSIDNVMIIAKRSYVYPIVQKSDWITKC